MGEDVNDLIKEYLVSFNSYLHDSTSVKRTQNILDLMFYKREIFSTFTMAVFVIRKEGEGLQEPPEDNGIVIDGTEVLHELTSVASACAMLLGLIYALNLAYPKPLRFTFEVLQKILMQLDQHKMSPKCNSLCNKIVFS
uniref:Uncharacterized protein n=1 Tax=Amphiprion ocellaris TaxID=80972 RepID=A0A3Q1CP04_AMPOC